MANRQGKVDVAELAAIPDGPLARTVARAKRFSDDGFSEDEILRAVRNGWSEWPQGAVDEVVAVVRREAFGEEQGGAR